MDLLINTYSSHKGKTPFFAPPVIQILRTTSPKKRNKLPSHTSSSSRVCFTSILVFPVVKLQKVVKANYRSKGWIKRRKKLSFFPTNTNSCPNFFFSLFFRKNGLIIIHKCFHSYLHRFCCIAHHYTS